MIIDRASIGAFDPFVTFCAGCGELWSVCGGVLCKGGMMPRIGELADALRTAVILSPGQQVCKCCGQPMPGSTPASGPQCAPELPISTNPSGIGSTSTPPKKANESWRDREPLL